MPWPASPPPFALLPECIAFALVAHLNPLMGLYGAFIICTLTALFGGAAGHGFRRRGLDGGGHRRAGGAARRAVPAGHRCCWAGLIMVAFGLLRLGKLVRMVPHPVMLGLRQRPGDRHCPGAAGAFQER